MRVLIVVSSLLENDMIYKFRKNYTYLGLGMWWIKEGAVGVKGRGLKYNYSLQGIYFVQPLTVVVLVCHY